MRRGLAIAAVVVAGLVAYPLANAWRDQRDPPGPATPLAEGETPLAAACRLRAEFLALPEPVHEGIDVHGAWKEWKFAVGTTTYGPYWEIRPTEATRRFVRSHSRLEIVAAVGPYVTDPALAPKAVAVLAALPVGDRHQLSFTSGFAQLLADNGGSRPGAKPGWEEHHLRSAHSTLLAVYGQPNAVPRQGTSPPGRTLDAAIVEVIAAMYVPQPVNFKAVDLSDQRRFPDWETTIATAPLPEVSAEFRAFMQRWPRDWLVTVLYPYATRGDPFQSSPREKLVWITGREAQYWPFSAAFGFPREKHIRAWEREIGELARGVCPGK